MFYMFFLITPTTGWDKDFATENPGLINTLSYLFKHALKVSREREFAFLQHAKIELPLSYNVDSIASTAGYEYVVVDVV